MVTLSQPPPDRKRRVAFVVQRYGLEVVGGAELHCRQLAERLLPWFEVDVLTSCALDYVTWENFYPEGTSSINGVSVRRFASAQQRHPQMNRWWDRWSRQKRPLHEEISWLMEQGPVLPGLLNELAAKRYQYGLFIFFTYLYFPTAMGLRLVADRSVLFPTANPGEGPLYLSCFRELFLLPRALIYCTAEERDHVHETFGNAGIPHDVIGVGFDPIHSDDPNRFRQKHGLAKPYLLFLGRIGASKGCDVLLDFFLQYVDSGGGDFELVLAGSLELELPQSPFIHYVGTVDGQEKCDALVGSAAIVCPSPWDCLSMLACEAWSAGRPILVTARSPVVSSLCARAKGGSAFADASEFSDLLRKLAMDRDWGDECGRNGRRFIEQNYGWDIVLSKLHRLIEREYSREVGPIDHSKLPGAT